VTVLGRPIPDAPDVVRMRGERHAKVQAELEAQGVDALVLLVTGGVSYTTGAHAPAADAGRASMFRPVSVVVRGDPAPHLFTPYPEGAPAELPADHLHPAIYPDLEDASDSLAAALREVLPAGATVGLDDLPYPLARALTGFSLVGSAGVMGAVKLCKTPDELACIRAAQRINELAMAAVAPRLVPGVRQTDLSAVFLQRLYELGAVTNGIDPIFQPMPLSKAAGPWTTHGDIAFPTGTTDLVLRDGDVVWVDCGIHYEGYASDFGRTWLVGHDARPTARQRAQFARWREVTEATLAVCKPGASGLDLDRAAIAANGGVKPWIEHFYLSHSVGTDSAEMPLIGTDLGETADEQCVLAPGMVLVIEPAIWDDGAAGYRSEDIYAVTDDGWVSLSDYPYDPFGEA
jgi:Xaa-Pro dipeptidase